MALVTTGQITIVDNNDAKPITAYITASPGSQQVFSKDESTIAYVPDWTTANTNTGLILTAKVYVGGVSSAVDVTSLLTNKKWSTDLSTAITGTAAAISGNASLAALFVGSGTFTINNTGGATFTIKSNFLEAVQQAVIYFEGDYTDPVTGLVSHIIAQISLGMVKTGTNAVFVLPRGNNTIEQATGSTKNVGVMVADLIRAAGIDTSGVTYRFFENNGQDHIYNGGSFATKYGFKTTAAAAAPTGALANIGTNLPALNAWMTYNTIVIHENAISDIGVFRVEAKDNDGTIYQAYFTVYDVSDPYDLRIISSSGDKLQNGIGSTLLTPKVYYGSQEVASLTGWTFTWTFYNKDGNRGAFIDTTRTAVAGGRNITVNTAGVSSVITYDGTSITFAAGDIIKVVNSAGLEAFYEVASGTGNTVTIRTPTTNTFLSYATFPAPTASSLVGGKLFVCVGSQGQKSTSAAASVTVTGDEVDSKARITCDANRP
jgi:hypothetical protein